MSVAVLGFVLTLASAIPWFAKYDLPQVVIQNLTESGCYRGLYGGVAQNGDPRTLSLFTCYVEGAELVGDVPVDASLCVVELFSPDKIAEAREVVLADPMLAKLLFAGRQEIVLANPLSSTPSKLCSTARFSSIAANVIFVPTRPIIPQSGVELNHPATQKFLLNYTVGSAAPNPAVEAIVAEVSQSNLLAQLTQLATDKSGGNTQITRNSYSIPTSCTLGKCINDAVNYITATLQTLFKDRPDVTIVTNTFQSNLGPNVILTIPGTSTDRVILGSHLDSRNNIVSNTAAAAPGADDNGSGSAVNLEFARILATYGQKFQYTIEVQWYVGEEQGLLGSKALATDYSNRKVAVVAMFNTDMIGYTSPTYGITLSFMTGSATASLTTACRNIVATYVPTLKTATTSACCSDQQSWYTAGYPAIGIFETPTTSVVYPSYHTSADTIEKVNMVQVYQFAQGLLSCIGEYAIPI